MAQFQEIALEIDEPVAVVRMKRPGTLHVLTDREWNELGTVSSEARTYIVNLANSVAPWSLMEAKRMVCRGWQESAEAAIDHTDLQATESMKRPDLVESTHAVAGRRLPRSARLTFKN